MAEQVNHPRHYNAREDGLECIDIIRHYTFDIGCAIKYLWRAGLKTETGKQNCEKETEDLNKALWYVEDYLCNAEVSKKQIGGNAVAMRDYIHFETLQKVWDIIAPYEKHVSAAIEFLLYAGLIYDGKILHISNWRLCLQMAKGQIQKRIDELEAVSEMSDNQGNNNK